MSATLRLLVQCTVLIAFTSVYVTAQVERVLPRKNSSSLEGTQFVVSFMQNEVLEIGIDPRLQIFISSQRDAIVTIDYPEFGPRTVYISANSVHVEAVTADHMVSTSEIPERKAIFISSDNPVVVYVLNTLATSTDTYTAIPIKHLGTQYFTMNRANDHYFSFNNSDPFDTLTRSGEFMVIATENFTRVTINPKVRTEGGYPANQPFSVTLNRGECYQVKSDHLPIRQGDLTGSRVDADKPIALLSGHMRSSIPTDERFFKDHLVEMLPPISKWGMTHITTPFALVEGGDYVRVMAADYGTNVEIITAGNTYYQYLANPGDWREFRVTEAVQWKSDKPVFVAQFMPSSNGASASYDPAMVIVPPTEVYVNAALFQFPLLEKQSSVSNQVFSYYINVVADSAAVSSLMINSTLVTDMVPSFKNQKAPGTNMYWAQVKLQPGVYMITANEGVFSGVMYGTSHADSYANLLGVAYEPVAKGDYTPPDYVFDLNCGVVKGTIRDSALKDPNLTEVVVQTSRTFNYQWAISSPVDGAGTVEVEASIRDMWDDAQLVIHAFDDKGNGKEWLYYYDAPKISVPIAVTITSMGNASECVWIPVRNTDSTPTRISRIVLTGDTRLGLSGTLVRDTLLQPGDSILVRVCFTPTKDTSTAKGEVVVELPCGLYKRVPIRVFGSASITALNHDFGPVRVGDTACAMVPIFNDGTLPVVIDSLIKRSLGSDFTVLATIPSLPLLLQPNDTVWIEVCYTPKEVAPDTRTDSVACKLVKGVTATYTGRGIRPQIHDIIIDFRQRKVGTTKDTIFVLKNTGEAKCNVYFGERTTFEPSLSIPPPGLPSDILGGEFVVVNVRFQPTARGIVSDTIPFLTDWRYHEPVRLILIGEGVLPEVSTRDIDFGDVQLAMSKDSTDTLIDASGNAPLNIYTFRVVGPDASAFTLPATLTALTTMNVSESFSDLVTFIPQRLGTHRCVIEFDHDAIVGNDTATSSIVLTGNGIPIPVTKLNPRLIAPATMPACTTSTIRIVLENGGNTVMVIDTIVVTHGGREFPVQSAFPFNISAGTTVEFACDVEPDKLSGTRIDVLIKYNSSQSTTISHDFVLEVQSPVVTSAGLLDGAPGNVVSFDVSVVSSQIRLSAEPFKMTVTADRERWAIRREPISVTLDDPTGLGQLATITVTPEPYGAVLTLDRTVVSPYEVRFTVPGDVLWRDPADTPVDFLVSETQCADEGESTSLLSVDLCAGALRMVRFDGVAFVTSRVVKNPVQTDMKIEFTSTLSTSVNVYVLSHTGQRISLAYNYPLQKGVTDCNFSTSAIASGSYWLMVEHETGVSMAPVMFVK